MSCACLSVAECQRPSVVRRARHILFVLQRCTKFPSTQSGAHYFFGEKGLSSWPVSVCWFRVLRGLRCLFQKDGGGIVLEADVLDVFTKGFV